MDGNVNITHATILYFCILPFQEGATAADLARDAGYDIISEFLKQAAQPSSFHTTVWKKKMNSALHPLRILGFFYVKATNYTLPPSILWYTPFILEIVSKKVMFSSVSSTQRIPSWICVFTLILGDFVLCASWKVLDPLCKFKSIQYYS